MNQSWMLMGAAAERWREAGEGRCSVWRLRTGRRGRFPICWAVVARAERVNPYGQLTALFNGQHQSVKLFVDISVKFSGK